MRDDEGVEHVVDYRNPTLGRVVTSKEYWGEVTRGTLRNLTFGIFGQDKYGWEQDGRSPEESSKRWNEHYLAGLDPDTGGVIRDRKSSMISSLFRSKTPPPVSAASDPEVTDNTADNIAISKKAPIPYSCPYKEVPFIFHTPSDGLR